MSLGQKISQLRQKRNLTLQEVAIGSDLTPSFLSRLERDRVNVSVANLRKLALFFGVPMVYFFEDEESVQAGYVVRAIERTPLSPEDAPIQIAGLLPNNTTLQAFMIKAQPGSSEEDRTDKGQKMVFLLEGILNVQIGTEDYTLYEGDSFLYFQGRSHSWRVVGTEPATMLTVIAQCDQ